MDKIEYAGENVLVVIEGLTMYLKEADVLQIFSIIEKAFPKGNGDGRDNVPVCRKACEGEIH